MAPAGPGYFVGPGGPPVTGELDPEVKQSVDEARASALKLMGQAPPDGGP